MVKLGMVAGAAGATVGRNIWKAQQPDKMTASLASIVHQGAEVDEAMSWLR